MIEIDIIKHYLFTSNERKLISILSNPDYTKIDSSVILKRIEDEYKPKRYIPGRLDEILKEVLDEAAFMGETPFTLEVTSPGVDRPLTQPRHFAKNVDRLLKIIKLDGSEVTGRILSNTDQDVTLTVTVKKETIEQIVSLSEIKRAVVEIEFNRKDDK